MVQLYFCCRVRRTAGGSSAGGGCARLGHVYDRVIEVKSMRWSNENAERTFRLQPFGARAETAVRFAGFTIPSQLKIGNHFCTADYLPFFQVTITSAQFL